MWDNTRWLDNSFSGGTPSRWWLRINGFSHELTILLLESGEFWIVDDIDGTTEEPSPTDHGPYNSLEEAKAVYLVMVELRRAA